jgi:hypothetical protein
MVSSRRTFLGYTTATAAEALLKPGFSAWASSFADTEQPGWYDKPMRWAQIGFAEDDPGNYDPQFWLDYFKRLQVEAVTLNAGGAVAFYPTQVPFHYRSKWLGNMDTLAIYRKAATLSVWSSSRAQTLTPAIRMSTMPIPTGLWWMRVATRFVIRPTKISG